MAEGFMRKLDPTMVIFSAGTNPAQRVNSYAIKAMHEIGIDISGHETNDVNDYLNESFDYVITVCDNAKETCPMFLGEVKERRHLGFEDPADASGSEKEVMPVYRRVRDEIRRDFRKFYDEEISK
jgi:arsenate reductase